MIIFLDIDGVMIPDKKSLVWAVFSALKLAKYEPKDSDKYGEQFNPDAVDALRMIIEATNADIIISSAWGVSGLNAMQEMWQERQLPGNVIDVIPILEGDDMGDKDLAIAKWVTANNYNDRPYVVIDDEPLELEHRYQHFVKVCKSLGLTALEANKAIDILNGFSFCFRCGNSLKNNLFGSEISFEANGKSRYKGQKYTFSVCDRCLRKSYKTGLITRLNDY